MSMFRNLIGMTTQSGRLPKEYQEVEYIENTNDGYIPTSYIHGANTKVNIEFYANSSNNSYPFLFGSKPNDNYNIGLLVNHQYLGGAFVYQRGHGEGYSRTTMYNQKVYFECLGINASYTNGTNTINLTASGGSATAGQSPIVLFNTNSGTTSTDITITEQYMLGKIYYCKFSESNTDMCELIPCYRKSDNKIGMYDIINDVFHEGGNQTSLVAGPNII